MKQIAELLAPAGSVETMYAAFAAGADGYITKGATSEQTISAIKEASVDELSAVSGISKANAKSVYQFYRND